VDANGQNLLTPEYKNYIPNTVTIFTTQKLTDQLPDDIVEKINQQVNETLSSGTRQKLEWAKSSLTDFDLPSEIKLPIIISNVHK
jgi:hypothetical protein